MLVTLKITLEYTEPVLLGDILPFVMADIERVSKVSISLACAERIRRRCFELRRRSYLRKYSVDRWCPGDRQFPVY